MRETLRKILESNDAALADRIYFSNQGNGTLPSTCPDCGSPLDHGRIGEDALVCRNLCGWRIVETVR